MIEGVEEVNKNLFDHYLWKSRQGCCVASLGLGDLFFKHKLNKLRSMQIILSVRFKVKCVFV